MPKSVTTILLLIGLTATSSFGAVYINTDFEGEALGDFATTSNSTGLINDADNPANVDIIANLTSVGSTVDDPSGQHLQIRGNLNKRATMENGMTLVTDGATSLNVSFKLYFNNAASTNDGRLLYSAAGDFSDTITIQLFSPSAVPDPGNFLFAEDQWYAYSTVINPGDVGGSFTDTAKLRWANDNSGAFGDSFIVDDILVEGNAIPEPTSAALLGLGGLLIARRRR